MPNLSETMMLVHRQIAGLVASHGLEVVEHLVPHMRAVEAAGQVWQADIARRLGDAEVEVAGETMTELMQSTVAETVRIAGQVPRSEMMDHVVALVPFLAAMAKASQALAAVDLSRAAP